MSSVELPASMIRRGIAEYLHRRVFETLDEAEKSVNVSYQMASDCERVHMHCGLVDRCFEIPNYARTFSLDTVVRQVSAQLDIFTEQVWSYGL